MITVVDYGMGNLRSVQKALLKVGGRAVVTSSPADIARADKIVFPGVGAFGDAMAELRRRRLVAPLKAAIAAGTPFLGLCLGLQLLFERSAEAPGVRGLCVLAGEVKRFSGSGFGVRRSRARLKVPHMGWNQIRATAPAVRSGARNPEPGAALLKGVPDGSYMYFVHSYYVQPADKAIALTLTDYGGPFVSGVAAGRVYGLQFHPEKSQAVGLRILKNFVRL